MKEQSRSLVAKDSGLWNVLMLSKALSVKTARDGGSNPPGTIIYFF